MALTGLRNTHAVRIMTPTQRVRPPRLPAASSQRRCLPAPIGASPEKRGEQLGHELHGPEAVTGFAGRFGFAFASFLGEDVRELLVTRK